MLEIKKKDRHRKSTRSRQGQNAAQKNYRNTKTKFSTTQKSSGKRGRNTGNVRNTRNTTEVRGENRIDELVKKEDLNTQELITVTKNGQDVTLHLRMNLMTIKTLNNS